MQKVTPDFVKGKKVLLRYDIDVALKKGERGKGEGESQITEDFKLRAGMPTLRLCLENASKVIIIGHLGRPAPPARSDVEGAERGEPFKTVEDEKKGNPPELSARPIQEWFENQLDMKVDFAESLEQVGQSTSKLVLLENIRFFHGEVPGLEYHTTCTSKTCDVDFAHKLASLGDVYVNEAFSAHNMGASTTIVPTLLPHAAGIHFAEEVRVLRGVRENPKKPFVGIMGGAKVADKLPVIEVLAKNADAVLVGGKLASEITITSTIVEHNVLVGKLNEEGTDIAEETSDSWRNLIMKAKMIVWNGPLGKFEDPKNDQSGKIALMVLESKAEIVVGGGDTVALLGSLGMLEKYEAAGFVSVGGGAMLKLLADGTLPTIEVLK